MKKLAKLAHSRIVLLHVADGWAARTYGPDAVSPEITEDTAYLERVRQEFSLWVSQLSPNWHMENRTRRSSDGCEKSRATWWP